MSYFSSLKVVSCAFSALCAYLTFGHHPHPLGYPCAKFCFCRSLYSWTSPWRKIMYSLTHTLSLFDVLGTEAFASEQIQICHFLQICSPTHHEYNSYTLEWITIHALKFCCIHITPTHTTSLVTDVLCLPVHSSETDCRQTYDCAIVSNNSNGCWRPIYRVGQKNGLFFDSL